MVKYNLIRQKMKTKWEDIIYDCEGRIIMKCYQKRKTIDKYYEKIIKEQNEQITELNDRMKQYFTQKEEAKIYINQMSEQMDQYYD